MRRSVDGPPNDEVLHGHPLYGSGLVGYEAHVVRRSPWIKSLMANDSVQARHDVSLWSAYRHFLLAFHDEVFECVAESHSVDVRRASLTDVLVTLSNRLTAE